MKHANKRGQEHKDKIGEALRAAWQRRREEGTQGEWSKAISVGKKAAKERKQNHDQVPVQV
jgi:hypothetical protein